MGDALSSFATSAAAASPPPLNDAQRDLLARLRRKPDDEHPVPEGLRDHLRVELERGLAPLVGNLGDDDLWLSKHRLEQIHGCEGKFLAEADQPFEWSVPLARGIVAHKAIEVDVTTRRDWTPLDLIDEAIARLQNEERGVGVLLQTATEAEIDAVRAEANNALLSFQECWPPLDRTWRPATEVSLRAELFDGRIVLQGKPDLTVGQPHGQVPRKVIVDFKTGRTSQAHVADLRFYALVEALRVGTPPRLLVTSYLDSGTVQTEAVTEALLDTAVRRTIDGATKILELRAGREPRLAPSNACRWCPALAGCETGQRFFAEGDDLDLADTDDAYDDLG